MSELAKLVGGTSPVFAPDGGGGGGSTTPASTGQAPAAPAGGGDGGGGGEAPAPSGGEGGGDPPAMDFGSTPAPQPAPAQQPQAQPEAQPAQEPAQQTTGTEEARGQGEPTPILSELPPEGQEAQQQQQQQQEQQPAELILGRFENQEALVDSWKQLNDLARGRTNELPDNTILEVALDRGLITENAEVAGRQIPETYNFQEAVPEGTNFQWKARDEAPEAYDEITSRLQKAEITQGQLNEIMPIVQEIIQQSVQDFGAHVNVEAEKGRLAENWGRDTDARGRAVKEYVINNLGRDIFYKPLGATAAGMQLLEQFMNGATGQRTPLVPEVGETTRTETPRTNPDTIDARKAEIMQSDAYRDPMHRDHQRVQQEYRDLIDQKNALLGL